MIFRKEHRKQRHGSMMFVDSRMRKNFEQYEHEMQRPDWPRTRGQAIVGGLGLVAIFFIAAIFFLSL